MTIKHNNTINKTHNKVINNVQNMKKNRYYNIKQQTSKISQREIEQNKHKNKGKINDIYALLWKHFSTDQYKNTKLIPSKHIPVCTK